MWTILVNFCFVAQATAASGWDDFTNNLATDLAPLIALFGEQATKQFLSESTSFLDNIIFAVAPLGIITATVSIIRVLGSASLRAFVGRANEGRGLAEAELCSSTSYDVCELWNNGGIARVFGRPQILEFIFHKEELEDEEKKLEVPGEENSQVYYEMFSTSDGEAIRPTAGIYKPLDYYRSLQPNVIVDDAPGFAPNPNLSLNIGIQKPGPLLLYGAAVFGCSIQTSVLAFASWAVYVKGLKRENQNTTYPYFWLTSGGTLLLVGGMVLCARLIERSTEERSLLLNKHVFWVQPDNQRVGDQTFEAFAYATNLKEYVPSWKIEEDRSLDTRNNGRVRWPTQRNPQWLANISLWLATSVMIFGFVMQFTGLRGLHSSVALYQYAAALIMALIRSLLRTKRLGQSENLLEPYRDIRLDRLLETAVEGHELDWQALQIDFTVYTKQSMSQGNATEDEFYWKIMAVSWKNLKVENYERNTSTRASNFGPRFGHNDDGSAAWTL